MWWFFTLCIGAKPTCNPSVYALCRNGYATVTATLETINNYTDCILCNTDNCTAPHPVSNTKCFPTSKSCAVCGTPLMSRIGVGYSLVVQSSCTSVRNCGGDVIMSTQAVFKNSNGLSIQGRGGMQNIVAAVCPVFVFNNAYSVQIDGLDITCMSNALNTAPAIFFTQSTSLLFVLGIINPIYVHGASRIGVLVQGGQFDNDIMKANTGGSSIGSIVVSDSDYRQSYDVILTYFYGSVNATMASKFMRFVLQPSTQPGGASYTPLIYQASQYLHVINLPDYTNEFDVIYEIMFANKDAYGWSRIAYDREAVSYAHYMFVIFIVLTVIYVLVQSQMRDLIRLVET